MATLRAHGLSVDAPVGWDASIYRRSGSDFALQHLGADRAAMHAVDHQPVLHLCSRPLPADRGDLGGGVVSGLGPQDLFVVLFEYGPGSAGTPLFGGAGRVPWPLRPADFDAASLRTQLPGQVGCQRFFSLGDRSFMLYVVLGGTANLPALVARVNAALAGVVIG